MNARGVSYVSEAITPRVIPSHPSTAAVHKASISKTCGSVISEGDSILRAAATRSAYQVDGSGVTVGSSLHSFDTDTSAPSHAAQDVKTGDCRARATRAVTRPR